MHIQSPVAHWSLSWSPHPPTSNHLWKQALHLRGHWRDSPSRPWVPAALIAPIMFAADVVGGLGASTGAALGMIVCVWAATRPSGTRLVWAALAAACAGLAVSSAFTEFSHPDRTAPGRLSPEDFGFFVFGTAAAAAHLAWPEVRRANWLVLGVLMDTVTVVIAAALWGASGFPPLGGLVPDELLGAAVHAGILVTPVITAVLTGPQLAVEHRRLGLALGIVMTGVLLAGLLSSPELAPFGVAAVLAWPLRAAAFALLAGAAIVGASSPAAGLDRVVVRAPLSLPGLVGLVALLGTCLVATTPPMALIGVLVAALCLREGLYLQERRRAHEELESSLELERRLLAAQGKLGPGAGATQVLQEACRLSTEVLRADAALAWMLETDVLALRAVAPERRDVLLGRQLLVSDADCLAPRVFRSGAPEFCEVRVPGARADRVLTMVLDAGMLLGIPVMREGAPVGTLVLVRERGRPGFSHFDLQRASLIVAQVESALRRLELYEEVEQQLREATLIHRFAVQAVSARSVNDVGWYLLESIRSRVPIDRGAVFLADHGSRMSLTPVAHFHPHPGERAASAGGNAAHLRVGLQYGDAIIGYADLSRDEVDQFTPGERALAERLAQQAAVAIQNVRLQEVSGKVSTYRELDRVKTELLNTVSHDLRGPLTNIKGYANTLVEAADGMEPEEQREYLMTIEEEADRLRDLLEHLLDLSKIEAGVMNLDLQPVQLLRIVDQTIAGIRTSTHHFERQVPEDLFVMADSRRLRQVLHNLLENAVKYSPQGGPIRVVVRAAEAEVIVSVIDRGVGIPRHQWDRVFRPYQRADTARSHGIAGTGLGLAICKGIVEGHGGRIWVESELGQGTVFSFSLARALEGSFERPVGPSPRSDLRVRAGMSA
jgi:signal transduction histidine kinase